MDSEDITWISLIAGLAAVVITIVICLHLNAAADNKLARECVAAGHAWVDGTNTTPARCSK